MTVSARRGAVHSGVIVLVGLLLLGTLIGPVNAQEEADPHVEASSGELSPGVQEEIGTDWLDQLNACYASGDSGDLPPMTAEGHEQLRSFDHRFVAVESGLATFAEEWDVVRFTLWDSSVVDGETKGLETQFVIDVDRLAESVDAVTDRVVATSDGIERRAFNVTFLRGESADSWLLDGIKSPPGGPLEFAFRELRPARPCPGLARRAGARDPFRQEPWCMAGGDGRRLAVGPYRKQDRFATDLFFESGRRCGWGNALLLTTGWPPGEPQDILLANRHRFVRDPGREVPGVRGYARRASLPSDAVSTGVTNGYATIWTSERVGPEAIFVQVGDRFERWPRDTSPGCGA